MFERAATFKRKELKDKGLTTLAQAHIEAVDQGLCGLPPGSVHTAALRLWLERHKADVVCTSTFQHE